MFLALSLSLLTFFGSAPSEREYVGAANRWPCAGGGPTHSGASSTAPVPAPIEVAWSHEAGGVIDSEPVVWDEMIAIGVQTGESEHRLRVLDVLTGDELVKERVFKSAVPLDPCIARGLVVVRSAANEISGWRVTKSALGQAWSYKFDAPVGPPLFWSGALFVTDSSSLHKFVPPRKPAVWSAPGGFEGAVALAPAALFAVRFDAQRRAFAVELDPERGTERAAGLLGTCSVARPHANTLAVLPQSVFVALGAPLSGARDEASFAALARGKFDAEKAALLPVSTALLSLPALATSGALAKQFDNARRPTLVFTHDTDPKQNIALATGATHVDLVAGSTAGVANGPFAIVGGIAFDLQSRKILWRAPVRPTQRPVLASGAVVFVDRETRLVTVRSKASKRHLAVELAADALVSGTLVLRDGSVEQGDFKVELASHRVTRGAGTTLEEWRAQDVLLLCDKSRQIVFGSDPLRGVEPIAREAQAAQYLALAKEARASNDAAVIDELVDLATAVGADEKELSKLQAFADDLRKGKNKALPKPAVVDGVRAKLAAIAALPAELHWEFAKGVQGEMRLRFQTRLLRATLERDPGHAPALEAVRALVPAELRTTRFDALDALTLVEATTRTPIQILRAAPDGTAPASFAQKKLEEHAKGWRGDLYAVRSAHMLVLTPVKELGSLARCIAVGEIVCQALEEFFGVEPASQSDKDPLVVELYPSREEYLKRFGAAFEWTAGFYSIEANTSHFYMTDASAKLQGTAEVMAHELTHHWLRARCPRWPYREFDAAFAAQKGFWIVEGFASMVENFAFDFEAGTWDPGQRESYRLDLVAHTSSYPPWKQFFLLSMVDFHRQPPSASGMVPSSLVLGGEMSSDDKSLFYGLATATTRYLYESDGGALRAKLFEFLRAYYAGERGELDLPKMLGLDPDVLGQRVVDFAKGVISGK